MPTAPLPSGFLLICGPDGAGKSTLVSELVRRRGSDDTTVIHHRPRLNESQKDVPPTTEPHSQEPYSRLLSTVKVVVIWAEYRLAWRRRIKPKLARGELVILERGWWDLVVDPRRYRLQGVERLVRICGRFLPDPSFAILLEGPPDVLHARKPELPAGEIERQISRWRSVLPEHIRRLYLDTTRSVAELADDIGTFASPGADSPPPIGGPWIGLPRSSSPRWMLPLTNRAVTRSALSIYQPVTVRGLVGWYISRAGAAAGLFALMPRAEAPAEVLDSIADHVSRDSSVALSRGQHSGRFTVLTMDQKGKPLRVFKVAIDERSSPALDDECDAVRRMGPHLSHPLIAPECVRVGPGVLSLSAHEWLPRPSPWRLDPAVAAALGVFWRTGVGDSGQEGWAHCDFAPWNLLRTNDGWVLLDWEEARDGMPPYYDVFHYLVSSSMLLRRPSRKAILRGADGEGWIGGVLNAFAEGAELNERDFRRHLVDYLVVSTRLLSASQGDGVRAIRERERFLQEIA